MTMLDDAKKIEIKKSLQSSPSQEEIELFLALLEGKVTTPQVAKILYRDKATGHNKSYYSTVSSRSLKIYREAFERGQLKIVRKK